MKKKYLGGAGYRSRYLSHAKRALYHLSYAPHENPGDEFAQYILLYREDKEFVQDIYKQTRKDWPAAKNVSV